MPQEYGPLDPSNQAATYPQRISPDRIEFGGEALTRHDNNQVELYEGKEERSEIEDIVHTGLPPIHKKTLEHVFFLFRPFIDPLLKENEKLRNDIRMLVGEMRKQYMFDDTPVNISTNVGYEVNYLNHRLLYALAQQPVTLLVAGNSITLTPGLWTLLSYPRGTRIFASGVSDQNPVSIMIRACDEAMPLEGVYLNGGTNFIGNVQIATGTNNIGNVAFIGDYPSGAVPITATSGNQANAIATATLPASTGCRTSYITGFEVTGTGATGVLVVTVTVTNTISGTLSYTYVFVAGVTTANQSLLVEFSKAIPGTGPNTAIIVTCPASGLGGTNNVVDAHGYQL